MKRTIQLEDDVKIKTVVERLLEECQKGNYHAVIYRKEKFYPCNGDCWNCNLPLAMKLLLKVISDRNDDHAIEIKGELLNKLTDDIKNLTQKDFFKEATKMLNSFYGEKDINSLSIKRDLEEVSNDSGGINVYPTGWVNLVIRFKPKNFDEAQ